MSDGVVCGGGVVAMIVGCEHGGERGGIGRGRARLLVFIWRTRRARQMGKKKRKKKGKLKKSKKSKMKQQFVEKKNQLHFRLSDST